MQPKDQITKPNQLVDNYLAEVALHLDQELLDRYQGENLNWTTKWDKEWDRHPWSDDWRDSHRR